MSSARPTRSSGRRASSSGSASEPLAAAEITPAAAARKASKRSCSNVGTTATQVESEQACSTSKPNLRWCPNSLHSMHSLSEVSILTTETNQMPSISPPHASSGPHTPKSTTHSPQPSFGVRPCSQYRLPRKLPLWKRLPPLLSPSSRMDTPRAISRMRLQSGASTPRPSSPRPLKAPLTLRSLTSRPRRACPARSSHACTPQRNA